MCCRDDLTGMTRFVTWDMEDRGGSSTLYRLLPTPKKMVEIYSIAVEKRQKALENLKVEDSDEEDEDEEKPAPPPPPPAGKKGGKNVDSKVLEDWNKATGGPKSSSKGPVKVSLASQGQENKAAAAQAANGGDAAKGNMELTTATTKDLMENDSVEVRTSHLVFGRRRREIED